MADTGAPLEQRGSSQQSVELEIFMLSQQWEAQRTIRNGDTPGHALRKGGASRAPLASLSANVAAGAVVNPFSLTAQRQKAAAGRACPQQQQQQQSVRFTVDNVPCRQHSKAAPAAHGAADSVPAPTATGSATTPAALLPATLSRGMPGTAGCGGAGSVGSPSPLVLFRGRLSFAAAESDSARKFDRPTTACKPSAAAGAGLKRKLLISPGADISCAFPTLQKPAAKQRRRSLGHAGPGWSDRTAHAENKEQEMAAGAAGEDATAAAGASELSMQGVYWSDPLPVPQAAAALAAADPFSAGIDAADSDMQDTAASPGSSCGRGCGPCSPQAASMDACRGGGTSPCPSFSPLPGAARHALPTVDQPDCGFPSISPQTMRDLLVHGAAAFGLSDFAVVDCRYDYEYAGGHLPGAEHLTTPEELAAFLAAPRASPNYWQHAALIFHCEFSTERGPRAAKHVRNQDRLAHLHDYPALSQPHVFVLQGGYKAFWKAFPELCEGGYTPMDHPDCTAQLKACHNAVKRAWAKTTRTFNRQQRQRRPSYRLRQSSGTGRGGDHDGGLEAARAAARAEAASADSADTALPPAVVAAQHAMLAR